MKGMANNSCRRSVKMEIAECTWSNTMSGNVSLRAAD